MANISLERPIILSNEDVKIIEKYIPTKNSMTCQKEI